MDNGEFATVQNTNSKLDAMINWSNSCTYNVNFLNSWRQLTPANVKPADSADSLSGNYLRVSDPAIFKLVDDARSMETTSPEFLAIGQQITQKLASGMQLINLMNIPTTIPTNSHYWKNYPKADNFYAAPYTWWSSFKKTIVSIEPTGK